MNTYVATLVMGVLVGVLYALVNVRSPAPPIIALLGLVGILIGEQLPPLIRHALHADTPATTWLHEQVKPHMFGSLPTCNEPATPAALRLAALRRSKED